MEIVARLYIAAITAVALAITLALCVVLSPLIIITFALKPSKL